LQGCVAKLEQRVKFLNTYVDALTMEETIKRIQAYVEDKACVQHVVINAAKVNLMQNDQGLTKIINECPLINADGQSIVWGARILGKKIPERVAGIDIFTELVKLSSEKGYKLYFFGAKEEVVTEVVRKFKGMYPSLQIAGYRNGYFNLEESKSIAENINKSGADILFVAFSSPMKEFWIKEQMEIMNVPFAMGVGGSFDVIAEKVSRAPKWMIKLGLEWLYRVLKEPWRIKRLGSIPKFLLLVVRGNKKNE